MSREAKKKKEERIIRWTKVSTENGNVLFRYFQLETMFPVCCTLARICLEQRCVRNFIGQIRKQNLRTLFFVVRCFKIKRGKFNAFKHSMLIVVGAQLIAFRIYASCLQQTVRLIISKHFWKNNIQIEKHKRHFVCRPVDGVFFFFFLFI